MAGFALFDTPIGRCAIVWRGGAITGSALPEKDDERLRASLRSRFAGASEREPDGPAAAIASVTRLLAGQREDFSSIPRNIDALGAFERAVLVATSAIPWGETRAYGQIASAIGSPGAARAVGRALGANPIPIIIPCHRVLASAGRTGGFSAPGGASTKLRILEIEGARRGSAPELFERLPWQAKPA